MTICTIHQNNQYNHPIHLLLYWHCIGGRPKPLSRNLLGRNWIRPNPLWVELGLGRTLPYSFKTDYVIFIFGFSEKRFHCTHIATLYTNIYLCLICIICCGYKHVLLNLNTVELNLI
jgi:hypothetical protein